METDKLTIEDIERLSEIYKSFGNVTRLKMLLRLQQGQCSAGVLSKATGISQSAASHQLKELKFCRIVKARKEGLNVFYSLADAHIVKMLENGIAHISREACDE